MTTTLILVVGVTLVVSALCSLLEATLYSTRVAILEAAKSDGHHVVAAGQGNNDAANEPLSLSVQTLSSVASTRTEFTIGTTAQAWRVALRATSPVVTERDRLDDPGPSTPA